MNVSLFIINYFRGNKFPLKGIIQARLRLAQFMFHFRK